MTFVDIVVVYLENQLLKRNTLCEKIATEVARPSGGLHSTMSLFQDRVSPYSCTH